MEESSKKKIKPILIIFTIIIGLAVSLSVIYFMYYHKDSRLNNLTSGLVSIQFTEGSGVINLQNEVPVIDDIGLTKQSYDFTVKNTSSIPINLNIKLNVNPLTTNIDLSAVRYGLFINDELIKKDYIHEDKILYTYENMPVNETINCKLVFWIDYYYDQPNKTFSATIVAEGVNKDIIVPKPATQILMSKVNIPTTAPTEEQTCDGTTDGLIAINTSGGLALQGDTIREYRYSGGENCVKNYIWFNNENWRIVGIFDGKIKIVKDTPIESAPTSYTNKRGDTAFTLQDSTETWAGVQVSTMYWNKDGGTRANLNDWSEAGLQYYLNEENSLQSNSYYDTMNGSYKGFIDSNTTYYLGKVNNPTPSNAYAQERNTESSNLWSGNPGTWTGKIGLLYPSDWGYATDPIVWNGTTTEMDNYSGVSNIKTRNWILKSNDTSGWYWLLSPSYYYSYCATRWSCSGYVDSNYVSNDNGVRPVLNLKSDTAFVGNGDGSSGNPYRLISE